MFKEIYCFRGRIFTPSEIKLIKKTIEQYKTSGRTKISQIVASKLDWTSKGYGLS
jgi:hypothetical protein